jgi:hypothetical protein
MEIARITEHVDEHYCIKTKIKHKLIIIRLCQLKHTRYFHPEAGDKIDHLETSGLAQGFA